ncbi:MAG TPA: tRNA pseudouridine(55) synthase TruB [Blastocatellia bacterium]|nr:tRNA pseudouridine(55) synthase TruB [Blastocatellia bacterium]
MLGALIVDKPAGITSHDVVARVRRVAGTRRVGHAGTLDPFATGVLVVCVGKATRLAQFLVGLGKQYLATVRLGFATDTQDLTGKQITPSRSSKGLSLEEVSRVVTEFVGPQLQMPPMYSAKKVGGERLYKAAREGREVAREPVAITIHSIELIETGGMLAQANADGATDLNVMVSCSSGTYVRTLANDIGERLGVGAHLAALRRIAVGGFKIGESLTLETLEAMNRDEVIERVLISPSAMLSHLPELALDRDGVSRVMTGQSVESTHPCSEGRDRFVRLCNETGALIGVGECDAGTRRVVRPRVVLEGKG